MEFIEFMEFFPLHFGLCHVSGWYAQVISALWTVLLIFAAIPSTHSLSTIVTFVAVLSVNGWFKSSINYADFPLKSSGVPRNSLVLAMLVWQYEKQPQSSLCKPDSSLSTPLPDNSVPSIFSHSCLNETFHPVFGYLELRFSGSQVWKTSKTSEC